MHKERNCSILAKRKEGVKVVEIAKDFYLSPSNISIILKKMGYPIRKRRSFLKDNDEKRMYRIWTTMLTRCGNIKHPSYKKYGAKGIKIEWKSFLEFRKDMLLSYKRHVARHGEYQTTIDRIDSKGNYSRNNCRWATYALQLKNRDCSGNGRKAKLYTIDNKTMTLKEWSKYSNIKLCTLYHRLYHLKWPIEKIITPCNT